MTLAQMGGWHCGTCHGSRAADPEVLGCAAGGEHQWVMQLGQGYPNVANGSACTCVPAADREAAELRRAALSRLAIYQEHRETLHADVRAALAAGATQAQVARASGLARQYVAKLARS